MFPHPIIVSICFTIYVNYFRNTCKDYLQNLLIANELHLLFPDFERIAWTLL